MKGPAYFDTPERAERLQLLLHLLNNAPEAIYLRAPSGAGKTRFSQQVGDRAAQDYQVIWLMAGTGRALAEQFPLDTGAGEEGADPEPDLLLESDSEKPALLIVDNADALQPGDLADLHALQRSGARVLLLGTGHLAAAEGVPAPQFVDLPVFTEAQTLAFIRAQGKLGPDGVDERMALGLHRAAGGSPGPLLDALAAIPVIGQAPEVRQAQFPWRWAVLGAGLALLLVAVLIFQDRITSWLQSPVAPPRLTVDTPKTTDQPLAESAAVPPPVESPQAIEPVQQDAAAEVAIREEAGSKLDAGVESEEAAPAMAATEGVPAAADSAVGVSGMSVSAAPDPVLDAVIEEAISAAEQVPQVAPEPAAAQVEPRPAGAPKIALPVTAPPGDSAVRPPEEGGQPPKAEAKAPAAASAGKTKPEAPVSKVVALPAKSAVPVSETTGHGWLDAQPAQHFTLQLVGSRDRASIDQFIRRYGIAKPYAVFVRDLGGSPWYSLVSGSYPSRDSAIAARAKLPKGVAGVWPRTFASIREQLRGG